MWPRNSSITGHSNTTTTASTSLAMRLYKLNWPLVPTFHRYARPRNSSRRELTTLIYLNAYLLRYTNNYLQVEYKTYSCLADYII